MSFLVRRLSYSSIRNYLSALNNLLQDLGCSPIDYANHEVKMCMVGICRIKGNEVKQVAPLLSVNLIKLFRVMNPTMGHTAVRAAMLLSFHALLRKAHVTDSDSSLLHNDLVFHQWRIMVMVRKSKPNQFRERVHQIPVAKVTNKPLCAIHWVRKHLRQCPVPADAQVFRIPRAGHSVPLPYDYYNQVLKAMWSDLQWTCELLSY